MSHVQPVAFSIGGTLRGALLAVRRSPTRTVGTVLLLCLPALVSLAAISTAMAGGATTALQGLLAGAPPATSGAVVLRPEAAGQRLLIVLALLAVITIMWPVAAALVVGAAAQDQPRRLRTIVGLWPAFAVAILLQLLVVGGSLIALGLLAWLAGRVQFQLPGVVLAPGLVLLGIAVLRLSLWPSIALRDDVGVLRSMVRAWRQTRGHAIRLGAVAIAVGLAALGPALLLAAVLRVVLDALAWHEVIVLSPVAIDAWSLAGLLPAALLALVLWGLAARELSARLSVAAG